MPSPLKRNNNERERDISAGTFKNGKELKADTTHLFTATLVRILLFYALTREEKEEASRFSFRYWELTN